MPKKLTPKQSKWVNETIKTLNPTEGVRRAYNVKNDAVAKSMASENLAKSYLKQAIEERMNELGLNDKYLLEEHKKVLKQDDNLPAKNAALDMAYKIKGVYAPEKRANLNINRNLQHLSDEELEQRIDELLEELKKLRKKP